MTNIEIIAIALVGAGGLICWAFAIQKMVRDSRRMADEEELERRGPPIPWRPGLDQVDVEAPPIHRTREGTVSGGAPTILKTGYQRRRDHAEHLEEDIRRTARERIEKRRSEEVSRRAREREQNEAEIRRSRRLGDDGYSYVSGMEWPKSSPDAGKDLPEVDMYRGGGGTSGGAGASGSWDADKPVSAVSEAPSASSDPSPSSDSSPSSTD